MATYDSAKVASGVVPRLTNNLTGVFAEYTSTAALQAGDVIRMIKVPPRAVVVDMVLSSTDMDSGTTVVLDVGDGGDTDRFIDGATVAQDGASVQKLNTGGGFLYTYTEEDTIDVIVQAGPATTTGTIKLTAFITNQQ